MGLQHITTIRSCAQSKLDLKGWFFLLWWPTVCYGPWPMAATQKVFVSAAASSNIQWSIFRSLNCPKRNPNGLGKPWRIWRWQKTNFWWGNRAEMHVVNWSINESSTIWMVALLSEAATVAILAQALHWFKPSQGCRVLMAMWGHRLVPSWLTWLISMCYASMVKGVAWTSVLPLWAWKCARWSLSNFRRREGQSWSSTT